MCIYSCVCMYFLAYTSSITSLSDIRSPSSSSAPQSNHFLLLYILSMKLQWLHLIVTICSHQKPPSSSDEKELSSDLSFTSVRPRPTEEVWLTQCESSQMNDLYEPEGVVAVMAGGIYLRWQLSLLQEGRILWGPKANDRVLQRTVYPHAVGAGVELSVLRCRIRIRLVKKKKKKKKERKKCWFERSSSAVSRMRKREREREMSICYC